MKLPYSLVVCLLYCWACNNIEDAKPAHRNTFIHFYEASQNTDGVCAEEVKGGYVILGKETFKNGTQNTLFIQTDAQGKRLTNDVVLTGGSSKALKVAADGYYIIGDSIKTNLESSDASVFDLIVYSARIFKLDLTGNVVKRLAFADHKNTTNLTDIHGGSVTLNAQNEVIILGTFKNAGALTTEKPFVAALNPTTLDTIWSKQYDAIDRDYVNSKSVHVAPTGEIIWATAMLKSNQDFSRSFLGIPYIKPNSTFENFSQYGQFTDQQLYANDIQPAASAAFGYGVIGTYASPTGANGNMFFMRTNPYGEIVEGSVHFFDGELSNQIQSIALDQSSSSDTGDALTSTQDGGFVLAGSTISAGKGDKDIFLVKVDGKGNLLWKKIIGGAGDETVNSIRETSDGGLLLCGSNNVSGLSSIFMMKTDKDGTLKN